MKKIKKLLAITTTFVSLLINCIGQENKLKPIVYFLADTIDVDKNNRVVEIGMEEGIKYYAFLCRCVTPYQLYPIFIDGDSKITSKLSKTLPKGSFLSWKKLSDLLSKHGNNFVEEYQFIIAEKLPDGTYLINEKPIWVKRKRMDLLH